MSTIYYANVKWTPEDILTIREDWTEEQAEDFLRKNEHRIQDRMVEIGWEVIYDLLPPETDEELDYEILNEDDGYPD